MQSQHPTRASSTLRALSLLPCCLQQPPQQEGWLHAIPSQCPRKHAGDMLVTCRSPPPARRHVPLAACPGHSQLRALKPPGAVRRTERCSSMDF